MKVIIIGGNAAGMTAAAKLRRLDKDDEIIVYEKGTDISYSGCGMPYVLGDVVNDPKQLIARTVDDFNHQDISVNLNHEVVQVLPKEKQIIVKDIKTDKTFKTSYDKLLISTGTFAKRTNVPGSKDIKVYVLNKLEDMRHLEKALKDVNHVTIIGGGYIGVEIAENLRHQHIEVDIIQKGQHLLSIYDQVYADKAKKVLETMGVGVHLSENLKNYEAHGKQIKITTDKHTYVTDLVIEAIGVRPQTQFLEDIDLHMLKNGAIVVNDFMETSIIDIYAAGDCVAYKHLLKDDLVYVPLGTHANKSGKIAALNMKGEGERFPGIIGTNIIKIGDFALAKTGLGFEEAKDIGLDVDHVDIKAKHQTGYYPGAVDIDIRFVYDKDSKIILGAQLFGKKGVSDRINIMALAITQKMKSKDFAKLDFAYAPPFSPVWDPLLIAASQIK